jgi:hypothetical protein
MVAKKKPLIKDRTRVHVNARKDEDQDEAISKTLSRPETQAAITIQQLSPLHDVNALTKILAQQTSEIEKGNMSRPEAMLMSQAHTLDELFNNLIRRAALNMGEYLQASETYFRLALKAQSQCRATLETLSAIKNPPVIFAKQANISAGHQQINNTIPEPRTENNKKQQNELLTEIPNATLDTRRKVEAIPVNSELEALG